MKNYSESIRRFISGKSSNDEARQLIPIVFKANGDAIEALMGGIETPQIYLFEVLLGLVKNNVLLKKVIIENLQNLLLHKNGYEFSWLMSEGIESNYLVIDFLKKLLDCGVDNIKDILLSTILEKEPAIPFDFRGNIIQLFVELLSDEVMVFSQNDFDRCREILSQFAPMRRRTLSEKIEIQTDGIDHMFPIPINVEKKVEIVKKASLYKVNEAIFKDVVLLLKEIKGLCNAILQDKINYSLEDTEFKRKREVLESLYGDQWISNEAFKKIEEDVKCKYRVGKDYVACWDQLLVTSNDSQYSYTVAELLRLCLLTADFGLPDLFIRKELLKFYRSVLKISGRASVGLKGGIFHVEHGVKENPTIFYMGPGSVIGKSFYIETVGGAVLLSNSYLGGGFVPILIHTHKHIPQKEMSGTDERKNLLCCIFVAGRGARFPMDKALLFEAADFIGKNTPYPGISVLALGN